jgi:hypothetical protein
MVQIYFEFFGVIIQKAEIFSLLNEFKARNF